MKELFDGHFLRIEEERGHVVVVARLAEVGPHSGVDGSLAVSHLAASGLKKVNGSFLCSTQSSAFRSGSTCLTQSCLP